MLGFAYNQKVSEIKPFPKRSRRKLLRMAIFLSKTGCFRDGIGIAQ
jgi:hypothetical protein